jgi:predicted nuclease with TOPRIM domain
MTPEDRDDIKRHFDVVAEDLRSDIRMVAEGVAMNTERLDRVDARLDGVDRRLDRVEGKVGRLEGEVHASRDEMRQGFAELRSKVQPPNSELDRRLTTLEAGHGDLKTRVEHVEAKLAS